MSDSMDDQLSRADETAVYRMEHDATMAFAVERRERIYQLHRQGLSAKHIARCVGGLAPYRVRKIIGWAEREAQL